MSATIRPRPLIGNIPLNIVRADIHDERLILQHDLVVQGDISFCDVVFSGHHHEIAFEILLRKFSDNDQAFAARTCRESPSADLLLTACRIDPPKSSPVLQTESCLFLHKFQNHESAGGEKELEEAPANPMIPCPWLGYGSCGTSKYLNVFVCPCGWLSTVRPAEVTLSRVVVPLICGDEMSARLCRLVAPH